jgi:hypothetical protein
MRTGKMLGKVLMLVVLPLILWGCATPKTMETYKEAGFLPDYTRLTQDPDNKDLRTWRLPDAELKKYNKVLLERILVWQKDDAEYKGIDPTELKALVDYFHEAVVKALGNDYPVVTEPGPDVMRLKVAITELVPTKPEVSVVVLVVPYATVADLASGAAGKGGAGSAPYLGDAAIEAMGLDSMTNDVLFEYVERKIGKKYDVDMSEGAGKAVTKGYSNYFKSYTTWGYTKQAFDYWAQKLRQRLDEIPGRKPAQT